MAEEGKNSTSVIIDSGPSNHKCGYCGDASGFHSHGMHARTLTVYDYQDLLDGGWRRSGTYVYKPDLSKMCCPTYTIRLNVNDFTPSKAQKKVGRRLERFLAGDSKAPDTANANHNNKRKKGEKGNDATQNPMTKSIETALAQAYQHIGKERQLEVESPPSPSVKPLNSKQQKLAPKGTQYTSSYPFSLFAFLQKKSLATATNGELPQNAISLAEILASSFNQISSSDFVAHAVKGHMNFSSKVNGDAAEQERVGNDAGTSGSNNLSSNGFANEMQPESTTGGSDMEVSMERQELDIQMAPSSLIDEEYELYRKYQMAIHGDEPWDCSKRQYERFLVSSPMPYVSKDDDPSAPECGYGAFHMQYRLGGKLIAVGVVDVLPKCLSSKYLFWDPDLASLSLGKISALKEIEWVQEACKTSPQLKYYYMGYYIHSCPKMRYKGEYSPSELMCPVGYDWVLLTDSLRNRLEKTKYLALSQQPGVKIEPNESYIDEGEEIDLEDQLVSLEIGVMRWGDLKRRIKVGTGVVESIEESLEEWRRVSGKKGIQIAYSV